jgi:nucleoside-diphosphate-sugar epimerase
MKTPRSVLVTGGNGFIGRHLVRKLLDDGCAVALLQRSPDRIDPRTQLFHVDRLAPDEIAAVLKGRRFDWLFHLAGYGVRPHDRDLETMFRINVDVTRELMNAAAGWAPRAVIVAGSGSEYRLEGVERPVTEDWPLEPYEPYGALKAAGTLCAAAIAAARRVPFAACRIFGVYGPGEAPHRLLPSLVNGLRANRRVPLSEGLQRRDFLFVSDVIEALTQTALALETDPQQLILNVGTGRPITVCEFAKTVAAILAVPETRLGFGDIPMRTGETMVFSGDSAKLHRLTGWTPTIELRDGIRRHLELDVSAYSSR